MSPHPSTVERECGRPTITQSRVAADKSKSSEQTNFFSPDPRTVERKGGLTNPNQVDKGDDSDEFRLSKLHVS